MGMAKVRANSSLREWRLVWATFLLQLLLVCAIAGDVSTSWFSFFAAKTKAPELVILFSLRSSKLFSFSALVWASD